MKFRILAYLAIPLLFLACNNDSNNTTPLYEVSPGNFSFLMNRTKTKLTSTLLDPVRVDDYVSTFGFRSGRFEDFDEKYIEGTRQIRESYIFKSRTEEGKFEGSDSLKFGFEVRYNALGQITYLFEEGNKDEFEYDSNGNLLYRKFYNRRESTETISRILYDSLGNLMFYYQYKILEDSTYEFDLFREYNYTEKSDKIIVEINEIENRSSNFRQLFTKKEFDLSGQYVREDSEVYVFGGKVQYNLMYHYDNDTGELLSKTVNTSGSSQQTINTFDTIGRLIEKRDLTDRISTLSEEKTIRNYTENNLIVSKHYSADPVQEGTYTGHLETTVSELDEYGNPLSIKNSSKDSIFTDGSTHTYEYDDKGNWIKRNTSYVSLKTKRWDYRVDEKWVFVRKISYASKPSESMIGLDLKAEKLLQEVLNKDIK